MACGYIICLNDNNYSEVSFIISCSYLYVLEDFYLADMKNLLLCGKLLSQEKNMQLERLFTIYSVKTNEINLIEAATVYEHAE